MPSMPSDLESRRFGAKDPKPGGLKKQQRKRQSGGDNDTFQVKQVLNIPRQSMNISYETI